MHLYNGEYFISMAEIKRVFEDYFSKSKKELSLKIQSAMFDYVKNKISNACNLGKVAGFVVYKQQEIDSISAKKYSKMSKTKLFRCSDIERLLNAHKENKTLLTKQNGCLVGFKDMVEYRKEALDIGISACDAHWLGTELIMD